jgi:GNAT superfamily N-acetyltransferase
MPELKKIISVPVFFVTYIHVQILTMAVHIVTAGIEQLDTVADLFNQYRVWYHQKPDLEGARSFLEERISNGESKMFLALHDGVPAGFVHLYPIFTSVGMRRAWLLNDLFVNEAHRGAGIATMLLEKAKELGRDNRSKWLLLQTDQTNIQAQQLYHKNGWEIVPDMFFQFTL